MDKSKKACMSIDCCPLNACWWCFGGGCFGDYTSNIGGYGSSGCWYCGSGVDVVFLWISLKSIHICCFVLFFCLFLVVVLMFVLVIEVVTLTGMVAEVIVVVVLEIVVVVKG